MQAYGPAPVEHSHVFQYPFTTRQTDSPNANSNSNNNKKRLWIMHLLDATNTTTPSIKSIPPK